MNITFKLLLLVAFFATIINADGDTHNHQEEEQQILEKLTKSYNANIRPVAVNGTGAVVVTVNMYIRNIQKIDQNDGNWKLQISYRQEWNDKRLAYADQANDLKYLTLTDTKAIWTPDIFFPNELESELHHLMKPNILLRIHPNGDVLYSTRISITLLCKDALASPKKSEVVCSLEQESYSYKKDDIILTWKEVDPIQITSHHKVLVPDFVYQKVETKETEETLVSGTYRRLVADFTFRRPECVA